MGIDSPIKYEWKLSWRGMPNKPVVNRLLKAMLEENVQEMENLFSRGADLEAIEQYTFQRVLYHVLGNYEVIDCIVKHGFNAVLSERYGDKEYECYDTLGYPWHIFARAWYLKKYDVMELLASNGFCGERYRFDGKAQDLDVKMIFYNNDVRTLKILLENGFNNYWINECIQLYPNSQVTHFLKQNPVIKRKTLALDAFKFKAIPKPQLKKERFFHRKEIRRENEILMANYQERLDAQKRYWNSFSEEQLKRIQKKEKNRIELMNSTDWKLMNEVLDDLLKNK